MLGFLLKFEKQLIRMLIEIHAKAFFFFLFFQLTKVQVTWIFLSSSKFCTAFILYYVYLSSDDWICDFFVCSMRGCEAFRDVYAVLGYGKCLHHAHQYVDCHRCHGQSHSLTQRRSNQFHRMPWIFVRQWNCCRKLNNTF